VDRLARRKEREKTKEHWRKDVDKNVWTAGFKGSRRKMEPRWQHRTELVGEKWSVAYVPLGATGHKSSRSFRTQEEYSWRKMEPRWQHRTELVGEKWSVAYVPLGATGHKSSRSFRTQEPFGQFPFVLKVYTAHSAWHLDDDLRCHCIRSQDMFSCGNATTSHYSARGLHSLFLGSKEQQ